MNIDKRDDTVIDGSEEQTEEHIQQREEAVAEQISKSDNLEQLYESYRNAEKDYTKVLTKDNMEDIITGLKKRKPKSDIER